MPGGQSPGFRRFENCDGASCRRKKVGKPYAERHEVFGGSNRQISIDLGFQVDVCHEHHEELHMNCSEWAQQENIKLRRFYQKKYEEEKIDEGMTPEQARNDWIILIGRNYL